MKAFLASTGFLASVLISAQASAAITEACSEINICQIEKLSYSPENGWEAEYTKEFKIAKLCGQDHPSLQLEPALGIELSVLPAEASSQNVIEAQPHVEASVYTYKTSYVVAAGYAPLSTPSISFSHRLTALTTATVKVTCLKK